MNEIEITKVDYATLQNKLIESNSERIVLQKENQQLKRIINKAIKYINKNMSYVGIETDLQCLYESDCKKVIEILKESDVK